MDAFVVLAALAGLTVAIGEVARHLPAGSDGALPRERRKEEQ